VWLAQWYKSNSEHNEFGIPIRNFARVTDAIYRGALPRAEGYRALVEKLGVRRVCDLRLSAQDEVRKIAIDAGIDEWRHIPFSDREAPRAESVREWLNFMRTAAAPGRGPIYTHCKGGRHRTGVLVGVLRVTDCGWTIEQATKEMMQHGWYDALGHRPLRDWFLHEFNPKDYMDAASPGVGTELSELAKNV
jgi:protein tyrosine phosphatase (PTP) superfamily phosphohydrolase (DUF442 family)